MIEQVSKLFGGKLLDIEIRTGDDARGDRAGHMGYEIAIITDRGQLVIGGCHDLGPEVVSWKLTE